jgi:CRISPR-associated endonuclease Cas1
VQAGELVIRDGLKSKPVERRYPKTNCPIMRVICPQSEGMITFAAVRWLHSIRASVVCLDATGEPMLISTAPRRIPSVSLRRKQALLSGDHGLGLAIGRALIGAKLAGQTAMLRAFNSMRAADAITQYAVRVGMKCDVAELTQIEGLAAMQYWTALAPTPIRFDRRSAPSVPEHWKTFGPRMSALSQSPRNATTPGNALINYLYGMLASEVTIAILAAGLDPMLAILHADTDGRNSLAYDLMEPARATVDQWLFQWLAGATFAKADFFEGLRGNVTLMRPIAAHLAATSLHWRPIAAAVVDWFVKCLARDRVTPLSLPDAPMPEPIRSCRECGRMLNRRQTDFCSRTCTLSWERAHDNFGSLINRAGGNRRSHSPEAEAKRVAAMRSTMLARLEFERSFPAPLRVAARAWYLVDVQPKLADIEPATLRRATGLSPRWAALVRSGTAIPHPRHFPAIARTVGVKLPAWWPEIGDFPTTPNNNTARAGAR